MRIFPGSGGMLEAMERGGALGGATDADTAARADEALVARARSGDRGAFDRIVESHLAAVWRVVWRILRHREDTEDVVQEVFLAAYQALPGFRGESRLSTWLHRIAVTRALNHLDRSEEKVRRASRALDEGADRLPEGASGDGVAPDTEHAPSPLQELEAGELLRRLDECLARLPAAWRAVLVLRDMEAASYEEIARMVGIALGTVRSRLARARIALRRCVSGATT
jgi:RNA polymerase sigma-70 factor (ECF subfamily)